MVETVIYILFSRGSDLKFSFQYFSQRNDVKYNIYFLKRCNLLNVSSIKYSYIIEQSLKKAETHTQFIPNCIIPVSHINKYINPVWYNITELPTQNQGIISPQRELLMRVLNFCFRFFFILLIFHFIYFFNLRYFFIFI